MRENGLFLLVKLRAEGLKSKLFLKGFFSVTGLWRGETSLSHQESWGEGHAAGRQCLLEMAAQAAGGSS